MKHSRGQQKKPRTLRCSGFCGLHYLHLNTLLHSCLTFTTSRAEHVRKEINKKLCSSAKKSRKRERKNITLHPLVVWFVSHYNNSGAAAVVDGLGYNSGLGKKPRSDSGPNKI